MAKGEKTPFKPQHQERQPAIEAVMEPQPREEPAPYASSAKLKGKVALITGGDSRFGQDTLMGRAAQPEEIAPCYLFLAARDSSYMTGQVLHPNGGRIVNG